MISFNDNQIKILSEICHGSEHAERFVGDITTAKGQVKFGEILDCDGEQSGLIINGVFSKGDNADIFISLKRDGEGKLYNVRDLKFDIDSILNLLKKFGINQSRIVLGFGEAKYTKEDGSKYLRNDLTISELEEVERMALKNNCLFYCSECLDSKSYASVNKRGNLIDSWLDEDCLWNINQVKRANLVVDKVVDIIKKERLSPLETVAFISAFAYKNFSYNHISFDQDLFNISHRKQGDLNNNIVAAINNGEIRCTGYDQFFNAIVGQLNFYFSDNGVVLTPKPVALHSQEGGHAVSVVYIEDKKYNVSGKFLVDININTLNFLKRPIGDFKVMPLGVNKDADNNIFDNEGNPIDAENILEKQKLCPLVTNLDGYKVVPREMDGLNDGLLGQDAYHKENTIFARIFGPHYKPIKSLHLSKLTNKECVKLMSGVYDNIQKVKIPTIEKLIGKKEVNTL